LGPATDFEKIGGIKIMPTGTLSTKQSEELLKALKARFENNMNRHPGSGHHLNIPTHLHPHSSQNRA
jgi:hypothetical protein